VQHRGRAALQRRVKGEMVEQAFQACAKEAPRIAGFSRRGTSTQCRDSRPIDKLRAGSRLSTGPGSLGRPNVPKGRMKIARQFTGGNAQHQTPTASRRDARAHHAATKTWCQGASNPHTSPQHRLPPSENRERWGSRFLSGTKRLGKQTGPPSTRLLSQSGTLMPRMRLGKGTSSLVPH
jgi:hypothetical protein